jgi:hypothetical protein
MKMKDSTALKSVGLVCLTVVAVAALIIDGEAGNAVAITTAGTLGVTIGYAFNLGKKGA